jgi:hypothetical protein
MVWQKIVRKLKRGAASAARKDNINKNHKVMQYEYSELIRVAHDVLQ